MFTEYRLSFCVGLSHLCLDGFVPDNVRCDGQKILPMFPRQRFERYLTMAAR